jgi:hypothetical protein
VGRLALDESRDATAARNDVSRYWSGHTLRLLLTLAAAAGLNDPVRVMTGLPVAVWTPENKRRVQASLQGTHRYSLNGRERVLVVDAVGVMMESAAALAAYPATDAPQAVIDIGGRTTDLFWAQGVRPVARRCSGVEAGVEKAHDALARHVLDECGRLLSPQELRAVFRSQILGQTPAIYHDGRPLTFNGSVDAALAGVASEIASVVAQRWGDERGHVASEAARVVLTGGGAYYFADALRAAIPHLEVPKAPELANALGYLQVGLSASEDAWQRNRV